MKVQKIDKNIPIPMKFCKDCRWAKPWGFLLHKSWQHATCKRPSSAPDPVTGSLQQRQELFCSVERKYDLSDRPDEGIVATCGPQGKFWEPKK